MKILYQSLNQSSYECAYEPTSLEFLGTWKKLTIEEDKVGLFFLFCHFVNGRVSDTCHLSIEEAKKQAKFEFDINDEDWELYPPNGIMNRYPKIISRIKRTLQQLKTTTLLIEGGISTDEIDKYCDENCFLLPDEAKIWFRICNGIISNKNSNLFTIGELFGLGIGQHVGIDLFEVIRYHPNWKENGYIPIGHDGCGNEYRLMPIIVHGERFYPVAFFDHNDNAKKHYDIPISLVASNVLVFLDLVLLNELRFWKYKHTYSSLSCFKNTLLKHDPDLYKLNSYFSSIKFSEQYHQKKF
ncbi:MAG: hypothetical protein LBC74_07595 [Planctomycetaceae bacterium]|jgi:hypothetical protein|nr:hypothetical protein [Planctomycetaceae bacterium]